MEHLLANPWFWAVIIVIALWELIWKGLGLWHSARNNDTAWYVVILILNTAGILPIIYLLILRNNKEKLNARSEKITTKTTTTKTTKTTRPKTTKKGRKK